jgi:PKD repeat protein
VSISSASADDIYSNKNFDDMGVTTINVYDSDIVTSGKSKLAIVNINEKVKFVAKTKSGVERVNWNLGDKSQIKNTTTKNQASTVSHTFKKAGTYKVKVDLEKTVLTTVKGVPHNLNYRDPGLHIITVKVVKKPDLIITKINYPRNSKNVGGIGVTVKNKGDISSKACQMKVWYKDKKLKQFTTTAKIPALKSGKSTQIVVKFQIPHKYKKNVKYVRVNSNNILDESIKSNNQKRF